MTDHELTAPYAFGSLRNEGSVWLSLSNLYEPLISYRLKVKAKFTSPNSSAAVGSYVVTPSATD